MTNHHVLPKRHVTLLKRLLPKRHETLQKRFLPKKQTLIATSSNNTEILALYEASKEYVWLKSLIQHVRSSCQLPSIAGIPNIIYEDNEACIRQIREGFIKGDKTKHIAPKFFFTPELQKNNEIEVKQVHSSTNLTDLFTKSLPKISIPEERVASLYEDNPSIANKDLDHDAVALILGCDNRRRVKGMGDGVSKTSIKYLDPYKKALQKEHESQVILQAQVDNLEKRLEVESMDLRREMYQMFASLSQANTQMQPSTERGSSSQGSQSSQGAYARMDQTTTNTRGPSSCKLQYMRKKNIIYYGRLKGTESPEAGFHRIVLDEIVDGSVDLFDGERKLGDRETLGSWNPNDGSLLLYLRVPTYLVHIIDPRTAACMEFLAQCNARKAKESNPACQLVVKRRTDDHTPQITVTFVNGVEEVIDATSTSAQLIRKMILEKGQLLETEQMFKDAGEPWPVIIPEEEIHQHAPGTKPRKAEEKKQ
ncbi:putative 39S ribosomal L53, mitochondrial [Cinnamomum micranthum f. kanehirae]|uniref:Large ribosomal subunit protein mL53 n=1 Tax=Cinnamomum micranthum f. kanehirae TaxID=337451 RepID=A0A3S3NH48_9MAGN|nr:putative 39S ribosomal L53, mitochondrial [Cinnamomum micranthum f. kanehirae]